MHAPVGHFSQPAADFDVGGVTIHQQSRGIEARLEWDPEAVAQVTVEALDLALISSQQLQLVLTVMRSRSRSHTHSIRSAARVGYSGTSATTGVKIG